MIKCGFAPLYTLRADRIPGIYVFINTRQIPVTVLQAYIYYSISLKKEKSTVRVYTVRFYGSTTYNYCTVYSQPWCQPNRVHKLFSRTRVLGYSRTVTFTQTPVQVRRKITFAAVTQNSSVRPYRFFKRTRAVLIYGRPASYRRIVCLVFAHGVQT